MDLRACVLYFSHMEQAFWKSWIQNLCADIFCLVWILKCCSVLICIFYFPKSVQHLLKSTKLVIPLWHITPEIEFLNVYLCVTNAPDMRRPKPHRASWQISSAMWRTLKTLTQVASTRKEEVAGLRPLFQFFSWNSDETNKDYLAHLWKNSKTFFYDGIKESESSAVWYEASTQVYSNTESGKKTPFTLSHTLLSFRNICCGLSCCHWSFLHKVLINIWIKEK